MALQGLNGQGALLARRQPIDKRDIPPARPGYRAAITKIADRCTRHRVYNDPLSLSRPHGLPGLPCKSRAGNHRGACPTKQITTVIAGGHGRGETILTTATLTIRHRAWMPVVGQPVVRRRPRAGRPRTDCARREGCGQPNPGPPGHQPPAPGAPIPGPRGTNARRPPTAAPSPPTPASSARRPAPGARRPAPGARRPASSGRRPAAAGVQRRPAFSGRRPLLGVDHALTVPIFNTGHLRRIFGD
jgi:hypothetical protein